MHGPGMILPSSRWMPSSVTVLTCVAGAFAPARMFVNFVGLSRRADVVCNSLDGLHRVFRRSEVCSDLQNMVEVIQVAHARHGRA